MAMKNPDKRGIRLRSAVTVTQKFFQQRKFIALSILLVAGVGVVVMNVSSPTSLLANTADQSSDICIESVTPNPFAGEFKMNIQCEKAQNVDIRIYNAQSVVVSADEANLHTGTNFISITPAEDLEPGGYVMILSAADHAPVVTHLFKK